MATDTVGWDDDQDDDDDDWNYAMDDCTYHDDSNYDVNDNTHNVMYDHIDKSHVCWRFG